MWLFFINKNIFLIRNMDSKYNAISSQQQQNNPFNFKRKLMNGNLSNNNNDHLKRFRPSNGNGDYPKNNNNNNNASNAGQNGNGKGLTIEEQRHQLPVYKVRKQWVESEIFACLSSLT